MAIELAEKREATWYGMIKWVMSSIEDTSMLFEEIVVVRRVMVVVLARVWGNEKEQPL